MAARRLGCLLLAVGIPSAAWARPGRPTAAELGVAPRGEYRRIELPVRVPRPGEPMRAEVGPAVIYLNRHGGTYSPGWTDDAIQNVSSIVEWETEMPPYPYGDASWASVLECTRIAYRDFNVVVTDEDPGASAHVEVVVSGHPSDVGMEDGVGGVAPMACQAIPGSVSFAFPETYGDDPAGICEAVAQESAHAFGLDHEMLCEDFMTYEWGCQKSFVDEDASCGEFWERPCACGGSTQNSFQYLMSVLGPEQHDPPAVEIVSPGEGDEVEPGFDVEVEVEVADVALDRLELRIDGEVIDTRFEEPWAFRAPEDLPLGPHVLEVAAVDETTTEGVQSISIEISEDGGGGGRRRGCSTAGEPGGSEWPVALVVGAWAYARRRRRRSRT